MAKIIPPFDLEEQQETYDYTIDLTDVQYRVVLIYRERQDSWYLDLYDSADQPIVVGRRLGVDQLVYERFVSTALPAGDLILADVEGTGAECTFEDLGVRCQLWYFEPGELASFADPVPDEIVQIDIL